MTHRDHRNQVDIETQADSALPGDFLEILGDPGAARRIRLRGNGPSEADLAQ